MNQIHIERQSIGVAMALEGSTFCSWGDAKSFLMNICAKTPMR